jgi:hypothetical protein
MQRKAWISCGFCFMAVMMESLSVPAAENEPMVPRTYPVADLVTPIPTNRWPAGAADKQAPKAPEYHFDMLVKHIKKVTGPENWTKDQGEIKELPQTLSVVIRQTPAMHEQIVDVLRRLRKEQDVQVCIELIIVTGPRQDIAEAAAAFPGELGRSEQEELRERLHKSKTLKTVMHPKVTTFNRQVGMIDVDSQCVLMQATVSDNRRAIRLKVSYAPEETPTELVSSCQTLDLHDGRAAAVRFEAKSGSLVIPPVDDAEECLVFVLPRIFVQEEEEELVGIPSDEAKERR